MAVPQITARLTPDTKERFGQYAKSLGLDAPMSAREIGLQVARKLGVEAKDEPLRYFVTSIGDSLQRGTKNGIIEQIGSFPRRWGIKG